MAQEGHHWGGSELLWSSAAEKLARLGNEVRVSVKDWGVPVPQIEKLRAAGCQISTAVTDYRCFSVSRGVDMVVISQGANHPTNTEALSGP